MLAGLAVLTALTAFLALEEPFADADLKAIPKKVESCCDGIQCPVSVPEAFTKRVSRKVHGLWVTSIFKTKIPGPLRGRVNAIRCDSETALDSCAPYANFDVSDCCERLSEPDRFYSPFFENMALSGFQRACPLLPGTFKVEELVFKEPDEEDSPIKPGYYSVNVTLQDPFLIRKFACYTVDVLVLDADEEEGAE